MLLVFDSAAATVLTKIAIEVQCYLILTTYFHANRFAVRMQMTATYKEMFFFMLFL